MAKSLLKDAVSLIYYYLIAPVIIRKFCWKFYAKFMPGSQTRRLSLYDELVEIHGIKNNSLKILQLIK